MRRAFIRQAYRDEVRLGLDTRGLRVWSGLGLVVEVVGTGDLNPANGRNWSVSLFFDPKDAGGDLKKKILSKILQKKKQMLKKRNKKEKKICSY